MPSACWWGSQRPPRSWRCEVIPLQLRVRNFLSYGEDLEPLRFDGIHVACITGANGHGKSALLDAITWALWGESRARMGSDDVIRTGATEVEVEFEFLLDSGQYRVLRKRSRAGRGQTSLDLHAVQGEGLRALTGNTVRDTQQRIVELLGMRYDTFINSAFLLQGRADEFTVKTPGDRKKILAEILELGRWDDYELRARAAQHEREEAIRYTEAELARMDAELAARPEQEAERQRLERLVVEREQGCAQAQTTRDVLQERFNSLGRARGELQTVEARLADGRNQLARARKQAADHRGRLETAQRVLAEAATIDAGYTRLMDLRAEQDVQTEKAARAMELQTQRAAHDKALTAARTALETSRGALEARVRDLHTIAARRPTVEQSLAEATAAAARYEALQAERTALSEALNLAKGERTALKSTNDALRKQFREAREHAKVLANEAQCPYCLTPLAGASRQRAIARCEQHNAELEEEGKRNNDRLKALDGEIADAETRLSVIDAEAEPLAKQPERIGKLRQGLDQAAEAETALDATRAELAAVQATLASDGYALEARAALAALDAERAALDFRDDAYAQLRREVAKLVPWEERYRQLERARETAPRETELLQAAEADAAGWEGRLAQDEAQAAALQAELAGLPVLETQLRQADSELRAAEAAWREANQHLGAVKQRLAYLEFRESERAETVAQRERLQHERGIYLELAQAFGKRGIQAMIIETAIPELEEEANSLLGRMTDNRMHLKLETQRDTQKGTTVETLDVKLADELGTRGYELFSGGEAFRANFALRVALARLVARRAGAPLQLLVVDEGFGTQDAEGIERVVEAIKAIQDDFARVLVVTHIAEMKEVFPVRIEVEKGRQGSAFRIV